MATELQAQLRTGLGSGNAYRMRIKDILPAVIYGKGIENKSLQVNAREVEKIIRSKSGKNTFINLKVEGDRDYTVLIKAMQGHSITRHLTHVDFWSVDPSQLVSIEVAVVLTGKAPGLLKGGIIDVVNHSVSLNCKADSIPEELTVDIGNLDVGHSIHLNDVTLPQGVSRRDGYNPTIVAMTEEKAEVVEVTVPAEGEAAAAGAEGTKVDAKADGKTDAKTADGKAPAKTDGKAPAKADGKAPAKTEGKK